MVKSKITLVYIYVSAKSLFTNNCNLESVPFSFYCQYRWFDNVLNITIGLINFKWHHNQCNNATDKVDIRYSNLQGFYIIDMKTSIWLCLRKITQTMVKCNSSYDCFYSSSIKYCKEPSHDDVLNGITEGECEWTWGIWGVLALFIAMMLFIVILCLICIKRHGQCVRQN